MEEGNVYLGRRRKRIRKWRKIFGEGKYLFLWRRRKIEKENKGIFLEEKYFFPRRRKRRKIFGERKKMEEKKMEKEKEQYSW